MVLWLALQVLAFKFHIHAFLLSGGLEIERVLCIRRKQFITRKNCLLLRGLYMGAVSNTVHKHSSQTEEIEDPDSQI